jgi:hypothetical protein
MRPVEMRLYAASGLLFFIGVVLSAIGAPLATSQMPA